MRYTGERFIINTTMDEEVYLEHMVRYGFAKQFVSGKKVLDIACGSGYGSEILANADAKNVVGVDISEETIKYCRQKYSQKNLSFIVGSACKIPLPDKSVDIVVSFETLEHISAKEQKKFLTEIKRVLTDSGTLIMSTPNKVISPPGNEFHIHELNQDEYSNLLGQYFKNNILLYQNSLILGSVFTPKSLAREKINSKLEIINNFPEDKQSLFFLSLSSNAVIPEFKEIATLSGISYLDLFNKFNTDLKKMIKLNSIKHEENVKLLEELEKLKRESEAGIWKKIIDFKKKNMGKEKDESI